MFQTARLKLTAWYLAIIMAICIMFSLVAFNRFHRELGRFDRRLPFPPTPEIILEIRQRLALTLILINGTILVLAGVSGYWLAGKTLQPIQAMVEEQNRFTSDASHELKTPLTSLKTAFEVYLRAKKKLPPEPLVKESLAEVNKLQKLAEGLLVLSRGQNAPMSVIKLQAAIDAAVRRVKPLAQAKKIKILSSITNLKINGNADQLTDLLVILLDNSIKYSRARSRVKVGVAKKDGKVLVSVTDWGMGIDKKDLPRIFDRFYRANQARTKNGTGGYGLGLSIAKKIVAAHHGLISVSSRDDQGTVFQLAFSLAG